MKIEFVPQGAAIGKACAIAVPAFEGGALSTAAQGLDKATGGAVTRAIASSRFTGATGQTLDLIAPHGVDAARAVIVGCGAREKFDARAAELAAGHAYQAVKSSGAETLVLQMPGAPTDISTHAAFGVRLAAYRFDRYRTTEKAENNAPST